MNYRPLGRTGVKVSELCLGAMTFGKKFFNIGAVDQPLADKMVARSLEAGINFFDTADVYSRGESEEILGRALKNVKADRDQILLATKVAGPMTDLALSGEGDFNQKGLSRLHIMASCEASLKRLGMDHIDLYQAHAWDASTPIEETLRAFDDLIRQGKVRYIGVSNWPARHIMKALCLSDRSDWGRFVSLQAHYSLAGRDLEHELLRLCREEGLAVLPWSPLSGGFLSGKYRRSQAAPADARRAAFDFPPVDERGYDAVEALIELGKAKKASPSQVALAWLLAQDGVTSVIIGARNMDQLEDNLRSVDVKLSPQEVETLSKTTAPKTLYPQWMVEFQAGRAAAARDGKNGKAAAALKTSRT